MPPPRKLFRMLVSPALWIAALFGGAGRFDWTRGWIAVAAYLAGMGAAGIVVARVNAGLMEARLDWRRNPLKPFDKVFFALLLPLVMLQPALAGMDAVRFRWSPMPAWLAAPGVLLFAAATALITWTMAVNRHAESTVRIQTDRGHTVVDRGPYRVVRHPMYAGSILMYIATPLMLGSLWAMAFTAAIAALFIWRTVMEERTLRDGLSGYKEYAARIRFRLVPGLW